jgi:acrylyl-CoA reductase (NADPH)
MFHALLINQTETGSQTALAEIDDGDLPASEVTVAVSYSTLNYKDALAITGKAPVVRQFPMVPGIDLAGTVVDAHSEQFKPGDKVLLNGWGVGERHWGGLAQKACVKADWLLPLPETLSARQSMSLGTAGYTATLCVMALEKHGLTPDSGKILVTGAAGGVGSVATVILSQLGYHVVAMTGRVEEQGDYLRQLGASEIIAREALTAAAKPLRPESWAGVIDVVGSEVLANACASTCYGGVVAACGLAGGMDFPATVAPFILRGITLVGIDSVMSPSEQRAKAWQRLASADLSLLDEITDEIALSQVMEKSQQLLAGNIRGRLVVDVNR